MFSLDHSATNAGGCDPISIALPVADVNWDGACLQDDQNQVHDWALATPAGYGVRGDLDPDGDVDLADRGTLRDNYKGIALRRETLSAVVANGVRGMARQLWTGAASKAGYAVRGRIQDARMGVWISRGPMLS